ncbi:hypothetical protein HKX48_000259 [Thoreauomyces humboldtii]|nr:hypothetical protein HKX48_000259 [Thoreauomyces humboldtii]
MVVHYEPLASIATTHSSSTNPPSSTRRSPRRRFTIPIPLGILLSLLALTGLAAFLRTYSPSLRLRLTSESVSSPPSPVVALDQGSGKGTGNWTRTSTPYRSAAFLSRYASCPLLDGQDRCDADRYDRLLRWRWSGTGDLAGLAEGVRVRDVVARCLNDETVGISGDSLSRQSFHSLACLFHAEGADLTVSRTDDGLDRVVATWPHRDDDDDDQAGPISTTLLWTGDDLNPYLLAYTGTRPTPTISTTELHPKLQVLLSSHAPVHVILNAGLWMDASSFRSRTQDFYQAFTTAIRGVLSLLHPRYTAAGTRVHLRTTPFRHFEGGDYDSDGRCGAWTPRFGSVPEDYYNGFAETLQNRQVVRLVEGLVGAEGRVTVLRADEVAKARRDAHRSDKDCSHYCLPGVPDAWNEVFLNRVWEECRTGGKVATAEVIR